MQMSAVVEEAPRQVRSAVFLLWASLLLAVVEWFASQAGAEMPGEFDWVTPVVMAVFFAANGYLIHLASQRKNWARIVLLIFTVLSVVSLVLFLLVWPTDPENDPWWSTLLTSASFVADIVAMIWLFSGPASKWFRAVEA
jgi:Na+/glutamate symporter